MKRELKGVLSVLREKASKTLSFDWHYTLGMLLMNRVGVPFYFAAKRTGTALPKQVERILSDIVLQQRRRNAVMEKWIADLSYELQSLVCRFAFLKGSVLAYCKFGDSVLYRFGERISNDIDILVSHDSLDQVDKALRGLGFVQGRWNNDEFKVIPFARKEIVYRRMTRGETAPYLLATQSEDVPFIEVDVNYSLGYLAGGDEEQVKEMLKDSDFYQFSGGGALPSFSKEKFLLHLILHQYKEATLYWMTDRHKDSQLYKYLDIYRVIASGAIDLEKFIQSAQLLNVCEEISYVLTLCNQLFPNHVMEEILNQVRPKNPINLDRVIDTENQLEYNWSKGILERTGCYDRKRYLKKL